MSAKLDPRFKNKMFSHHPSDIHSQEQKCENLLATNPSSEEPVGAPPSKKHRNDSESMPWKPVDEIMKSGTDDIAVNDDNFSSSKVPIIVNIYPKRT